MKNIKTKEDVDNGKNDIKPTNIAIIGAGAFGTSVARMIVESHPDCSLKLWAYEKELAQSINNYHINNLYLPGINLPSSIICVTSIKEAVMDSEALIFATPSKVLYDISLRVKRYIRNNTYIGYLTKGFCRIHNKILPMSSALARVFPSHKNLIVAIYGPSHAEEVSKGYHTCLNVASVSSEARKVFVDFLSCDYIACRETDDIIGVDLGTTLKNPAAIAAGILSMIPKCGDNLAGALIAEALSEMMSFGKAFNAREETIIGIAGLGDLVATALSDHSRNRRFGRDIAKQILSSGISFNFLDRLIMILKPEYGFEKMSESFNYLAEGIYVIEPILELAKKNNISMPVYRSLYEILLNKKNPVLLIETVKHPEKFDEIFKEAKIYVTKKKRGLENKRGGIFKNTILKNSVNIFLNSSNFNSELINFKKTYLKYLENNNSQYSSDFSKKEYDLLRNIDLQNIEKWLSQICKLYIKDISDNFNNFIYKIIIKIIKILNFFNMFVPRNNGSIFENNIKILGSCNKIKKINDTSNLVYISTYRSYLDFVYINMAIDRFGFYIPRFFIEKSIVNSKFKQYILRLMGGYFIDSNKLSNPVYREVAQNYIATLVEHGVQILIFPEINLSKDGKIGTINRDFLNKILEALYKNNEEIALVPIEVSYYKKPHNIDTEIQGKTLSIRKILDNRIKINFSEPIFVSEFSNSDDIVTLLSQNIDVKWRSDSYIYPHYVFCRIIKDNNYELNIDEANGNISEILQKYNIKKYKPHHILKDGINFILENNIGSIDNGKLSIINKDEVDYYSNLIYN